MRNDQPNVPWNCEHGIVCVNQTLPYVTSGVGVHISEYRQVLAATDLPQCRVALCVKRNHSVRQRMKIQVVVALEAHDSAILHVGAT